MENIPCFGLLNQGRCTIVLLFISTSFFTLYYFFEYKSTRPWVVKFTDTNEVEAVPKSWLDNQGGGFYPNVENKTEIKNTIRHEVIPKRWILIKLMSREEYNTFKVASMKASKARGHKKRKYSLPLPVDYQVMNQLLLVFHFFHVQKKR